MRYKNGSKSQFISPLVSTGVLEVQRQTELRRLEKNVKIFIQWFSPGSWKCNGRLNSAVWKKRKDFHTMV